MIHENIKIFNAVEIEKLNDGVIFRDVEEAADGSLTERSGSDRLYQTDSVIIAISQGPMNQIVGTTDGLNTTDQGLLAVDADGRTSRPGIFASGDVVNGARTVVEAVAYSKRVAEAMDTYMQSLPKD